MMRGSHDLSLGSRPGLANLCSLRDKNGMTVSIESKIAIDHLISSQSKGEYREMFIEAAPKGSESSHSRISESDP